MDDIFLSLKNVTKSFSAVKALSDFSIDIQKGKVHCIAGQNGSGKSTLIKVISGVYTPNQGEVVIEGKSYRHTTPKQAIDAGIQVIYQDFSLFPNLTVAENLSFSRNVFEHKRFLSWKKIYSNAKAALENLSLDIDLNITVDRLSVAEKQLVAIARAMSLDAKLLIMDEPTTALTQKEVMRLFEIVNEIRNRGIAVIFISHKLREMQEISDIITVIRNGKKVIQDATSAFSESKLTYYMTGQEIEHEAYIFIPKADETARLKIENWQIKEESSILNLSLHKKEIVGIAGLMGSGRTDFALSVFGLLSHKQGNIYIDGKKIDIKNIHDAIDAAIGYIPEDRLTEGLFLSQSIRQNCLAVIYDKLMNKFALNKNKVQSLPENMVKNLSIKTNDIEDAVNTLSGGNQQRVVLAKWLLCDPKILILNRPTVGVDVGSKFEIHEKIRELSQQQDMAVLMISDDIGELIANCNRIIIMHKGEIIEEMQTSQISEEELNQKLRELK